MTTTIGAITTLIEVVCHVGSMPINASMPYHTYTLVPLVYTSQGYGSHYYAAPPPGYGWYPNPAAFPTTPTPFSGWHPYHTPTAASVYTRPQPTLPPPPLFNVPERPAEVQAPVGVTGDTTLPAYSEPQPVGPTPAIDQAEVRRVVEEAIPTILGPIVNQIPRVDDLRRMMTEVAQGKCATNCESSQGSFSG